MSPKTDTQKSAKRATVTGKAVKGFTDEERAAMKERAQELKAEARRGPRAEKADEESEVLAKIAEMPKPDRAMAERLHAIIKASAPALSPRTWYGMPAYAKDGNVVCFFQSAHKFKARYGTFGFSGRRTSTKALVLSPRRGCQCFAAGSRRNRMAIVTRSASDSALILRITCPLCAFTVGSLMPSSKPTCLFKSPETT